MRLYPFGEFYFYSIGHNKIMVRILVLVLISFCFTALSIYASCDLPTGGACKLEDLRKEEESFSKILWEDKFFNQLDKNYAAEQEKFIKKDTPKRVDFDKLNDIEINK